MSKTEMLELRVKLFSGIEKDIRMAEESDINSKRFILHTCLGKLYFAYDIGIINAPELNEWDDKLNEVCMK
ncbi:MAG: hypothetical protein ACI4FZ_07630 [Lachnospiraceae bacterium]